MIAVVVVVIVLLLDFLFLSFNPPFKLFFFGAQPLSLLLGSYLFLRFPLGSRGKVWGTLFLLSSVPPMSFFAWFVLGGFLVEVIEVITVKEESHEN